MPVALPEQTPETKRRERVAVVLVFVFAGIVFGAGLLVAYLTSSPGWGFVAVVVALLIVWPCVYVVARKLQGTSCTVGTQESDT
jgi:cobalamin synthase